MRSAKQQRRMDAKARRRRYIALRDRLREPGLTDFQRVQALLAHVYREPLMREAQFFDRQAKQAKQAAPP